MTKRLTPGSRPRRDGWEFQECYSHTRDINIDIPLLLNQEIVCWQRSITLTACFFLKLKYGVLCLASVRRDMGQRLVLTIEGEQHL